MAWIVTVHASRFLPVDDGRGKHLPNGAAAIF